MRQMEDPRRRVIALAMYRGSAKHTEVAHALGVSTAMLHAERKIDIGWDDQVEDAMANAMEPVLAHAQQLALQADPEGNQRGSHQALELLMKWYTRNIDRDHESRLLTQKGIQEAALSRNTGTQAHALSSPQEGAEFLAALTAPQEDPEDADIVPEGEDEDEDQ